MSIACWKIIYEKSNELKLRSEELHKRRISIGWVEKAMATKEAFSCIFKVVSVSESEKEWESDGIRYIWGKRFEYVVSGDFIGTMVSVVNGKSDSSTGDGVAFGNSMLKVENSRWGPGAFELRWTCNVRGEMVVSGEIIGNGGRVRRVEINRFYP